ncbi:ABC transporter [Erythrobacter sp. SG61-1L]|nr:ABC transporter [Erythrobacter sp. SG61-1L]
MPGGMAGNLLAHLPEDWRLPLLRLAIAWVGLTAWFWHDWAEMADQWWNSSTYNHILLVPAIVGWLVWLRAKELVKLTPSSWWPGLIIVAGAMALWLLGAISGLNLVRQLGAVVAMQGAVVALIGPRATAGLVFPLAYMLFLVPFGDELVPALQMITAKLTIALVHLSGIPAEIEGVFIDTPIGLFEVAEACSGVKFLIAMVALGTLVAHICFERWGRRAAFLAVAIILPILANGVRAWGTIYIAQFQGIEFAKGFDHIFYGWVFFAIVMAILLAIGWRFFDRAPDDALIHADDIAASPLLGRLAAWRMNGWGALGAIAALSLLSGAWAARAEQLAAPVPPQVALPVVPGWTVVDYAPQVWWQPRASGADHRLLGRYRDSEGHEVDVFYAFYAAQDEGREAGAFGQGALVPDTDWRWLKPGPPIADAQADLLLAQGSVTRLAATFYRTGDLLTGSNSRLKLANMRDRLLVHAEPTMTLILSAEERPGHPAAESIAAFRRATGPTGEWMDGIAQLP